MGIEDLRRRRGPLMEGIRAPGGFHGAGGGGRVPSVLVEEDVAIIKTFSLAWTFGDGTREFNEDVLGSFPAASLRVIAPSAGTLSTLTVNVRANTLDEDFILEIARDGVGVGASGRVTIPAGATGTFGPSGSTGVSAGEGISFLGNAPAASIGSITFNSTCRYNPA